MEIIVDYLFIGWLFGLANLIIALNESNSYDQHYIISQTLAVILYWPVIIINMIYYFAAELKEKKTQNKNNKKNI